MKKIIIATILGAVVNIIDNTLSYFFAGLVIAAFIKPKPRTVRGG